MRRSFSVACVLVLMMGVCSGCQATGPEGATQSSPQTNAATVPPSSDGKQYRVVCLEKAAHGGNEQVLSRWLDSRDKASALGRYHGDFKEKGHRWRLEERVRPESAKPSKRFDNPAFG